MLIFNQVTCYNLGDSLYAMEGLIAHHKYTQVLKGYW